MPDLLAHFGTGYAGLRGLSGGGQLTLILTGSLLPDLAWIVRRFLVGVAGVDPVGASVWLIPWHTPWSVFVASIAIGVWSRTPTRAIGILSGAACVHFLLDAAQSRFGNGVLFFYPFSLHETSWHLFWPEDLANHGLSLGSLLLLSWLLLRPAPPLDQGRCGSAGAPEAGASITRALRVALACGGVLALVATAAVTRRDLLQANVFGLGFVTNPSDFEGLQVSLDRDRIVADSPLQIQVYNGRRFTLVGTDGLRTGEVVSLEGTYEKGTIRARKLHRHNETLRSLYSCAGLLLFSLLLWKHGISGRNSTARPHAKL